MTPLKPMRWRADKPTKGGDDKPARKKENTEMKEILKKLIENGHNENTKAIVGDTGKKITTLVDAIKRCRPGQCIRIPNRSGCLVERGHDGTWYY